MASSIIQYAQAPLTCKQRILVDEDDFEGQYYYFQVNSPTSIILYEATHKRLNTEKWLLIPYRGGVATVWINDNITVNPGLYYLIIFREENNCVEGNNEITIPKLQHFTYFPMILLDVQSDLILFTNEDLIYKKRVIYTSNSYVKDKFKIAYMLN